MQSIIIALGHVMFQWMYSLQIEESLLLLYIFSMILSFSHDSFFQAVISELIQFTYTNKSNGKNLKTEIWFEDLIISVQTKHLGKS